MRLIILQTKSEGLSDILLLVFVVKEDFTFWRKALNAERSITSRILVFHVLLWIEIILVCEFLLNFDERYLVWLQFLSDVHLIVCVLGQIGCEMSLLKHIRYSINELKFGLVPNLCSVVLVWHSKSGQLIVEFICLVVNNSDKLKFLTVLFLTYWTLQNRVI